MKKLLIVLLPILFFSAQLPLHAQGVSFGIPLPFPFLFYNFGPTYSAQPYYGGYYRPYYPPPNWRYGPGWYGYGGWRGYYAPGY